MDFKNNIMNALQKVWKKAIVKAILKEWSNGLVVRLLDSQSRGPVFKTTWWLQGRLSVSSF